MTEFIIISVSLLLIPSLAPAYDASDAVCNTIDATTVSKTKLTRTPNYFFKYLPNTTEVSYSDGSHNYIFDLKTRKELKIPGAFDPVATPDGRYMTVVQPVDIPDGRDGDGIDIYPIDNLMKGDASQHVYDEDFKGVYQSVGNVGTKKEPVYRIITDKNGLTVREYKEGKDGKIEPQGDAPALLCADKGLSLPMISHDGQYLAALDIGKGDKPNPHATTKIWKLKDGQCVDPPDDLGIQTGKIDFMWGDPNLVTFHVSNNNAELGGYFSVPSDAMSMNVFVLNRKTGEMTRVTNNTKMNSTYPQFTTDGQVVYMNHPSTEATAGEDIEPVFVVADYKKGPKANFDFVRRTKCDTPDEAKKFHAVLALGTLWTQVCSKYSDKTSANAAALFTLSLDPVKCREMVTKRWKEYREKVINSGTLAGSSKINPKVLDELQAKDLIAACPKLPLKRSKVVIVGDDKKKPDAKPENKAPVPVMCLGCHPTIPFNDPAKMKDATKGRSYCDKIDDYMNKKDENDPKRMPIGYRFLSPDEKAKFEVQKASFNVYLKKICK